MGNVRCVSIGKKISFELCWCVYQPIFKTIKQNGRPHGIMIHACYIQVRLQTEVPNLDQTHSPKQSLLDCWKRS
jgi:hypothetical protein